MFVVPSVSIAGLGESCGVRLAHRDAAEDAAMIGGRKMPWMV